MRIRLVLLLLITVSLASTTLVLGQDRADGDEESLSIQMPAEFVLDREAALEVVVDTDRAVESAQLVTTVEGEKRSVVENDSAVLQTYYTPDSIGELEFEFTVEARFEDGQEATFQAMRTVPPEQVLDNRVWRGVAMPVPEKFGEEVRDAASNRSLPRENDTMFWGPTTGDGTMYALLTDERVEYGPFAMVGSLATEREERDHVVQDEFVLCFYRANYPVFYDEPAVKTPAPDEVEHGDVVAYDIEVQEVEDGFYAYRGDGTDASVVFVDHSDVLEGERSADTIRGAVVDVPFAHSFYSRQYGVEADLYVYPMETLESSRLPLVEEERLILSGETNVDVLRGWGRSGWNRSSSEGRYTAPQTSPSESDVDDTEEGGREVSGEGPEEGPAGQPQPLGFASIVVSITLLLALRSGLRGA